MTDKDFIKTIYAELDSKELLNLLKDEVKDKFVPIVIKIGKIRTIGFYFKEENQQEAIEPKVWSCGHTEDEHNFADVMFCVRDPKWFENYKNGN